MAPEAADSTPDELKPVPVATEPTVTPHTVEEAPAAEHAAAEEGAAEGEPQAVLQLPVVPASPPVQVGETPGWRARRR
jgi:hypothetical protein